MAPVAPCAHRLQVAVMSDELSQAKAQQMVQRLFGPSCTIEQRSGGFIVLRAPPPDPEAAPAGLAPPTLEIIGEGKTRREAIQSAQHALGVTASA